MLRAVDYVEVHYVPAWSCEVNLLHSRLEKDIADGRRLISRSIQKNIWENSLKFEVIVLQILADILLISQHINFKVVS